MSDIIFAFIDEINLVGLEEGDLWEKMVSASIPTYVHSQTVQLFMTLDLVA